MTSNKKPSALSDRPLLGLLFSLFESRPKILAKFFEQTRINNQRAFELQKLALEKGVNPFPAPVSQPEPTFKAEPLTRANTSQVGVF